MREVTATLRAFTLPIVPVRSSKWVPKPGWRHPRFGKRVLVLDVETLTDTAQRLLVGCYRLYEWSDMALVYVLVEEGLFVRDGLGAAEMKCVGSYAKEHQLRLLTRTKFASLLIKEGYDDATLIVGFNLKFDLGAIVTKCGRGRKRWRAGWRLRFLQTKWQPPLRVRAVDSVITFFEWGTYRGMKRREAPGRRPFAGRFLDLRQWAYALFGEKHSLESLPKRLGLPQGKAPHPTFGVVSRELLDYLRQDVNVTWQCFLRLLDIWNRDHPFLSIPSPPLRRGARVEELPEFRTDTLLPTRAASGASLAEAYLRKMGIQPRLVLRQDFPRKIIGWYTSAYYAGRSEAPITHAILPVLTLDMSNTYTSMCILAGLGDWLTASRLEVRDCTQELQALLARIAENPDLLYRPETLRLLTAVALIHPDGDVVPVRDKYDPEGDYTLGLNRARAVPGLDLWYMAADLAADVLLTNQVPRILKAVVLVPQGQQKGLRRVRIAGAVTVDPATLYHDLREGRLRVKARLAEARTRGDENEARHLDLQQCSLKAVMEPLAYGLFVKYAPRDTGATLCDAWGLSHFQADIPKGHEEHPGEFAFPPHAAAVAAIARLMLAMKEREVQQRGGAWVTMDTDSIAIVATEHGGLVHPVRKKRSTLEPGVHALSYAEVETIRAKFDVLLPGLWRYEDENEPDHNRPAMQDRSLYILSLGTKRYAVANRSDDRRWIIRKASEHGLGHLLPPGEDWITRAWQALFEAEECGSEAPLRRLPFAEAPAVGQFPVTRPDILDLLNGRRKLPRSRPFAFFLVAYPATAEYPHGWCRADRVKRTGCPRPDDACPYRKRCPLAHPIRPIAPYEADLTKVNRLPWVDLRTGKPLHVIHGLDPEHAEPRAGRLIGRRILDVLRLHRDHADPRYVTPEGSLMAGRQDVLITGVRYITKEMHHLEEALGGLWPLEEVAYEVEPTANGRTVGDLRNALRECTIRELVEETRLSERTIRRARNGPGAPYPIHQRLLWQAIERLRERGRRQVAEATPDPGHPGPRPAHATQEPSPGRTPSSGQASQAEPPQAELFSPGHPGAQASRTRREVLRDASL